MSAPWQLAQFLYFRIREGGLEGPAPAEHGHLAHFALAQHLERVVGDVGLRQLIGCAAQDPCNVHRDVSDAHHGNTLGGEIELMVPVVRVAVEPRHELGGGVASCEILAGDPHPPICFCADGKADLVKVLAEVGQADVFSHLHIAEEPESLLLGDAVEHPRDVLDLLVIRGDTKTHEAERSREAIEHVDLDVNIALLEKVNRQYRTQPAPTR